VRKQVGELKIRNKITKQRLGIIRVSVIDGAAVEIDLAFGNPHVSFETTPDIANSLADLIMEATGPKFQKT